MIYPNTFDRLHIGPAGHPADTPDGGGALAALERCIDHGWDTMELAFVHNVYLKADEAEKLAERARELQFPLSAHASYYINLASAEKQKVGASRSRIAAAASRIAQAGGHSVVYHSAYMTGRESAEVTPIVIEQTKKVEAELNEKDVKVWLRPELTGKPVQHGDPNELIKVANAVETVLPCIDWSHLHARWGGGFNSYDEWCEMLDKLAAGIKDKNLLGRMHMHVSGIEYGPKGERKHIPLATCDLRYKELMQALKQAGVCGTLVVEAPKESEAEDIDRLRDAWEAA
ncbi:TIM barrel protein [bacterium]|nr:TIM barrel protein [bacterium]